MCLTHRYTIIHFLANSLKHFTLAFMTELSKETKKMKLSRSSFVLSGILETRFGNQCDSLKSSVVSQIRNYDNFASNLSLRRTTRKQHCSSVIVGCWFSHKLLAILKITTLPFWFEASIWMLVFTNTLITVFMWRKQPRVAEMAARTGV
jgi:hypothetical protein